MVLMKLQVIFKRPIILVLDKVVIMYVPKLKMVAAQVVHDCRHLQVNAGCGGRVRVAENLGQAQKLFEV